MAFDIHTIDVKKVSTPLAQPDRLGFIMQTGVANVAGGSAGASVVTAVAINDLPASATYNVQVTPNQDARAFVSGKTQTGFNVTLIPGSAANTLAAGTFDLLITF